MSAVLVDQYGRVIGLFAGFHNGFVQFRCIYCRPPEGVKLITHDEILRYEEILTIVGVAQEMGIRKIRGHRWRATGAARSRLTSSLGSPIPLVFKMWGSLPMERVWEISQPT